MVELYELKLMPTDDNYGWPADIDEHVAQLDFGGSMMMDGHSLFGSVMIADPSYSTDSLDMDTMLRRCHNTKNDDYKLTFEDSGQWTTSGIGGSFTTSSPPLSQNRKLLQEQNLLLLHKRQLLLQEGDEDNHNISLRLLEKLNAENGFEDCGTEGDRGGTCGGGRPWLDMALNLNNNNEEEDEHGGRGGDGHQLRKWTSHGNHPTFTTWGQIRDSVEGQQQQTEDSNRLSGLSDSHSRVNDSNNSSRSTPSPQRPSQKQSDGGMKRPGSLISNFIEQQHKSTNGEERQSPLDHEYSEVYLGNGRYIDMNDNEIGFVPLNTAPLQAEAKAPPFRNIQLEETDDMRRRGCLPRSATTGLGARQQKRVFADLSASRTTPDLKFIALSHKVPSIWQKPTSASLDNLLQRTRKGASLEGIFDCIFSEDEETIDERQQQQPDSGLGSSHSEGPSHIDDWPSLSILLPRSVVDACSFFKTNSSLLLGSSSSCSSSSNNSIERRRRAPPPPRSFTSGAIRRLSSNNRLLEGRPATGACLHCLGGAGGNSEAFSKSAIILGSAGTPRADSSSHQSCQKLRLHAKELALVGLPVYDQKRSLVERVVEGVAELLRGGSIIVLLTALEKLLNDGLKRDGGAWEVISQITGPGPITAPVFRLIKELEAVEKPENSRRIGHFFQGLVRLHSVDGWFSYVVLKQAALGQFYVAEAFLLGAQSSYRSLFCRLIECLELLSVLDRCGGMGKRRRTNQQNNMKQYSHAYSPMSGSSSNLSAAKVPSDSRVPKSSSMPTKLAGNGDDAPLGEDSPVAKLGMPAIREASMDGKTAEKQPSRIPVLCSHSSKSSIVRSRSTAPGWQHRRGDTPSRLTCNIRIPIPGRCSSRLPELTMSNSSSAGKRQNLLK